MGSLTTCLALFPMHVPARKNSHLANQKATVDLCLRTPAGAWHINVRTSGSRYQRVGRTLPSDGMWKASLPKMLVLALNTIERQGGVSVWEMVFPFFLG